MLFFMVGCQQIADGDVPIRTECLLLRVKVKSSRSREDYGEHQADG